MGLDNRIGQGLVKTYIQGCLKCFARVKSQTCVQSKALKASELIPLLRTNNADKFNSDKAVI